MPFIIRKHYLVPDHLLQITDLQPNTSQRNAITDPPGQSRYAGYGGIRSVSMSEAPVLNTAGGTVTVVQSSSITGWFLTNVDAAGAALTNVQAWTSGLVLLSRLQYGSMTASSELTVDALNTDFGMFGLPFTIDSAQLLEILDILAGAEYRVLPGTQIEAGGVFSVEPAVGATGGPGFVAGTRRRVADTGALRTSLGSGVLSQLCASTFEYGGLTGPAVTVYDDDGSLMPVG